MDRRKRVEDAIAESALHLLRTGGPRAVTVEAVAAHSGVAKTTIYRRHLNRRDMLSSALNLLAAPRPLDPDTDAAGRLRWLIESSVETIEDGIGLGGFAALLTGDDPEFTALFRRILADQRAELTAATDAAGPDGGLRPDIDTATLIDAVVGAYVAERARTGRVEKGWKERLFALFWPTVRAPGPS